MRCTPFFRMIRNNVSKSLFDNTQFCLVLTEREPPSASFGCGGTVASPGTIEVIDTRSGGRDGVFELAAIAEFAAIEVSAIVATSAAPATLAQSGSAEIILVTNSQNQERETNTFAKMNKNEIQNPSLLFIVF